MPEPATLATVAIAPPAAGHSPAPPQPAAPAAVKPVTPDAKAWADMSADQRAVFAPNFGQVAVADFNPAADTIQFSRAVFADLNAVLASVHNDGHGNAVIADVAHETVTIQHVTTAQLLARQCDFHVV